MPWSEAARQAARERCIARKPSQFSTGPKTPAGKAIVGMNNWKHGLYSRMDVPRHMARIRVILESRARHKEQIRLLLEHHREQLHPQIAEALEDFCQESAPN